MEVSKFKNMVLVSLALLTFTVIIYDIHVSNPPKALYIQVWGYEEYEEEIPESWTVVNITNHPLKEGILWYVNKSIQLRIGMGIGERIYIFSNPKLEDFFGKYYVSSWCLTCAVEMSPHLIDGDTYYHVLVGYSNVRLCPLEYAVAWAVSIATVILWIFAVSSIQKLKAEKELKTNV